MSRLRRITLGLWMLLVVVLTALYAANPNLLKPAVLVEALRQSDQPVSVAYVVLSFTRAFTLVPSTVLIFVGMLLFPTEPWFVMTASLAGIVASAALTFYFFDFLGLGTLFERSHAAKVRWLEGQMRRKGFWIVLAWSAFPFVPTDVVCYVAGTLRMNVWVFLSGVAIGEIPIIGFYVLVGGLAFAA